MLWGGCNKRTMSVLIRRCWRARARRRRRPLLAMLEAAGAHVEGLRLANARAMLKAHRDIAAGRR